MSISQKQLDQMLKGSHAKIISGDPLPDKKKKGRTGSKKVIIDGIEFDSTSEGNIYCEYKLDLDIKILELQPQYIVFPGFSLRSKKYQDIKWTLDFRILDKGVEYVIDVKSIGTYKANSKSHSMRRKLFLRLYPELILKEIVIDGKKRTEKVY